MKTPLGDNTKPMPRFRYPAAVEITGQSQCRPRNRTCPLYMISATALQDFALPVFRSPAFVPGNVERCSVRESLCRRAWSDLYSMFDLTAESFSRSKVLGTFSETLFVNNGLHRKSERRDLVRRRAAF
jgi:hypothetical protein